MKQRPPLERVHIGITVGWAGALLAYVGFFIADGWSEPKFGGMFVVFLGGVFVAVGLVVLGFVLAIARWGLISTATRSLAALILPPLTIAALVFLPPMLNQPRHTTLTGLTISHLPGDVERSVPNLSDGANFNGFVSTRGGKLWIGVRLQPEHLPNAEVVERSGRRFLIDTTHSPVTRVAEVVDGVQLEVQSNYLGVEPLLEIAEGLSYRRELDYYRRNAAGL